MSLEVLTWAFRQEIRPATRKITLVALADCSNADTGEAFPAIATMQRMTSLNRKTLIRAIDDLQTSGWIEDTGKRVGGTGQVKVYRIVGYRPENGTVKESQIYHERGPILPPKSPKIGTRTQKEPEGSQEGAPSRAADYPLPTELDTPDLQEAWTAWQKHRREKRQPITPTAAVMQLKKLCAMGAARALAALQHSTENGYQGLFEPKNHGTRSKNNQPSNSRNAGTLNEGRASQFAGVGKVATVPNVQ